MTGGRQGHDRPISACGHTLPAIPPSYGETIPLWCANEGTPAPAVKLGSADEDGRPRGSGTGAHVSGIGR
jgi:hypothetical protein